MKIIKYLIYVVTVIFFTVTMSAQVKIGNNPTTIDNGSILEMESTTKGFVPPRMTTAQMNAIPTPLEGSMVYNTNVNCLHQYKTSGWVSMCTEPLNIVTENITGTTNTTVGTTKKDVPGVTYTFTPNKDGILIVNAHGLALPTSNGNSSQGGFYLVVNNVEVDGAYYSTFDGQNLVSLGSHVSLNYTAKIAAGTSYTIKVRVRRWTGNTNDQVNVNLSGYAGAQGSDLNTGKTRMIVTYIPF